MRLKRRVNFVLKFFVGFLLSFVFIKIIKCLLNNSKPTFNSYLEEKLAHKLFNSVKILCVVTTTPENHKTKAIFIKNTWGNKCNKLLFVTSEKDSELETIIVNLPESRNYLRQKTRAAFLYAHDKYLLKFDWILKADDDRYQNIFN